MAKRFQVIIVGGGPVGVALAVDLGQRGIECAIIERGLEPQRIPKGQNLTNRTLEHFYFWGCLKELRAARVMPPGYPIGGITAYRSLNDEYWTMVVGGGGRGEGVAKYYYQSNERLPQYLTEEVLRNRMRELPSVQAFFGWNADTVEVLDDGVRVTVSPVAADAETLYSWSSNARQQQGDEAAREVLEADYVVGCDGGRSLVRDTVGIERTGTNFDQKMVLTVFRSKELHEKLGRFPERTTYRVLKPELKGFWQFFGRIDVGEGFFFHAPVPIDASQEDFDFHGLMQEAAGFDFAVDFDYVGFWDLRVMTANDYNKGRAFIAGDAAHQHPPYGGYGLNTGLEDATNLAWKLAAVLQGWGGQRLLDSYGEERRPIFRETGELVIEGGIEEDRKFLERYNPDVDRAEFEAAWAEMARGEGRASNSYEPHYEGSPVVMGPEGAVCSIHGRQTLAAQAGHHLAPQTLSTGENVYEALGPDFTLLALDAADADVEAVSGAAAKLGIPLKVIRDTYDGDRAAYESRLVIVRPDQYVVWAGDAAPADVTAIWERVTGR